MGFSSSTSIKLIETVAADLQRSEKAFEFEQVYLCRAGPAISSDLTSHVPVIQVERPPSPMSIPPQPSLPPVPPRLDLITHRPQNPPGASSPGVTSKVSRCALPAVVRVWLCHSSGEAPESLAGPVADCNDDL